MIKWSVAFAVIAATALMAPASAETAAPKAAGVSQAATDFSAARRTQRRQMRVTVRPYRAARRYATPYEVHSYDLYANSHPYFVPGAAVGARGLRHDGIGTAAYGFGYQ